MRNTSGAIVLSVAIPLVLTLALAPPPSFARGGGGGAGHSSSGMSSAVGLAHPSLSSRAGAPAADSALHANGAKTPGAAPDSDAAIDAENRRLDRSVDSICRGC
jgi:hypothetical protein